MFGYVIADTELLSSKDRDIYQAYYCGLCRVLGKEFGIKGKLTLNFDMTFLYLFLSAYFNEPEETETFRCGMHPAKAKYAYINKYAYYAACMNILLTYYKLDDDVRDEKSIKAGILKGTLKKSAQKAKEAFGDKSVKIKEFLDKIEQIENSDEHNADIPANCFGGLMGVLFDIDGNDERLYQFGCALGRVIYIMDACIDLKSDLKKCRYNPMVETSSANFQQILTILLSDCTNIYDTMDIGKNKSIIENVLYQGIWTKFRRKNN